MSTVAPDRTPCALVSEDEWLERARSMKPILEESAQTIDAERELPERVIAAMHERQLFRLTLPRSVGGAEMRLPVLVQVAEIIAGADASAAWCMGQAFGCAMSAAFMDDAAAEHVFGPADAVLAWGAGVVGKAIVVDGGYRVSGTWRFASGSKHATWIGAHCKIFEANGEPRLDASGKQVDRTALFPRASVEIHDDWYVMGLKGTRSEGYTVEDAFVDEALTLDRENFTECRQDATLFKFPTTNVYASVFSGVAVGIARTMLDDFIDLTKHKIPRGAGGALKDNTYVLTRIAELEARLGSAQAYRRDAVGSAWNQVSASGALTMDDRARIRLATTNAILQATRVTEEVYRLAGATAIFESGSFERRFRDAHAVSQQVQGRFTNLETVGRHLLGLEATSIFM